MRLGESLSGSWDFGLDPEGSRDVTSLSLDRAITVPLPWQAAFPELQHYSGYAWYRRTVDLDDDKLDGELLLHFGAVDYWCQVFINGSLAGEHEGGYTPFTIPARQYLHAGSNELAVRVYDSAQEGITVPRWPDYPGDPGASKPPFNAEDVPHGKQEWYINAGGIWQDVTLTAVPATYISHVQVTPNIHSGEALVSVEVVLRGAEPVSGTLQVSVGADGEAVTEMVALERGQQSYEVKLKVDGARLWSLEDPHLYAATVTLQLESGEPDEVSVRFGFREISTEDGKILLNGEPVYLLSALDQDLYPDTIYTVPSREYLEDEFRKAKELGLNCLRCHIKPPDPVYLDLADEMGLLVWAEIPSWRTFYVKGTRLENQLNLGETIQGRVEQTLRDMVRRDFNHPSLVIWTIVNEDWGTSLPLSASDRRWVDGMYELCKTLDPTRLVVDNSPCAHPWGPNIHVRSDLDDFHFYGNIPDQAASFAAMMEQVNMRPLWTYSSYGDAKRTGQEPLVLSEFGNWGLPTLDNLRRPYGGDPPWFSLGPWWSGWEGEPGWPRGVDERFKRYGLDKIWGSYEEFARATQWHQFNAMKYEIEAMRRQPNIMGYVITELSDIYWESNGLLDFYRNPKAYHDAFGMINSPDVVVPQVRSYNCWDDKQVLARLYASRYSGADWSDPVLRWKIEGGDEGETRIPALNRGDTITLGRVHWRLPRLEQTRMVDVQLSIGGAGGVELATNRLSLLVLPSALRATNMREPLAVILRDDVPGIDEGEVLGRPGEGMEWMPTDDTVAENPPEDDHQPITLRATLRKLGYHVQTELTLDTRLAVTNYPTPELLRWVRDGGDLVFISEGPSPFFWVQPRGGAYSGSWLTSFSWLRADVHKRLSVTNPLGLPYASVMPRGTIVGLPVEDPAVQPDLLAGMVSGWVGNPAVHTVQFRYGRGRVVMTTFKLEEASRDAVAVAMLHDLLEHLHTGECQPTLRANY